MDQALPKWADTKDVAWNFDEYNIINLNTDSVPRVFGISRPCRQSLGYLDGCNGP